MQKRRLGHSPLQLTSIGLGTWAMGGAGWRFSWGPQDDTASRRALHEGLDAGINWIDTAAVYGLGHAEHIVGQVVRERRDKVWVATKCGRVWDDSTREIGKCLKRASVRREVEASLQRLGLEVIDLYQIHWPEPDEEIEEGWGALQELLREGKIRYAGVSNFSRSQLERVHAIHPVTSLQPPYSMLRREIETDILPWCATHGVGIIAYSPLQAGILTGKYHPASVASLPGDDWRRHSPFFNEPGVSFHLETVERLRPLAAECGVTVSQLALAWVLRRPEITSAIVGSRSPEQIRETVQAGDVVLPEETLRRIEGILARTP